MKRGLVIVLLVGALAALASACGDDEDTNGGGDGGGGAFQLSSSPEFVNFLIPGRRPLALVSATGDPGGEIALSGSVDLEGASVSFEPAAIAAGAVAEVWLEVPDVSEDVPFTVTVTGTRGGNTASVDIQANAAPGSDDLESTALDIADVFLAELGGEVSGLPAERSGLTNGTPVAGLLVVSHYAWFTDEFEIGLSWHIMVAPDDWAELYLRPRTELAPTQAFRLSSWSTALAGGEVTIEEVPAPAEVMR